MSRSMSKPLKIVGIVALVLVGILVVIVVGVNVFVRTTYASYYDEAQRDFAIPGVNKGFVCQDLDYYDEGQMWFFSGYMADGSPSPIYVRNADGTSKAVLVACPDGTLYDGHGGGLTSEGAWAYLTSEEGYYVLDASAIAEAADGATVTAVGEVDLGLVPAFLNIEQGMLYAGNFYEEKAYPSPDEYEITTPGGAVNRAVICAYAASADAPYGFETEPARIYSAPGKVQGVCVTPDGKMVLSTSFGLATSELLVYDIAAMEPDTTYDLTVTNADGAQHEGATVGVYMLDDRVLERVIAAPPMSEGIEYHDGRIYISEESASNKYIYGKLYNAGAVYSIPMA